MRSVLIVAVLGIWMIKSSSSADPFSCDKGCVHDEDCPTNSHCVAISQSSECGVCLCKAGYRSEGRDCLPNKQSNSQKGKGGHSGGLSQETTKAQTESTTIAVTSAAETSTSTATASTGPTGPTTQGPPPAPEPIKCEEWDCKPQLSNNNNNVDDPLTVRAGLFNDTEGCKNKLRVPERPCNVKGGGACYGLYCLTVEPGNDYCICQYNRVDRQCAIYKNGKCANATGQLPPNAYRASNKRFQHKSSPDYGALYGRHFASNFEDCVKLCQWSTGSCRSINFGTLAGQKICEMISPAVTKGSLLEPWLVDAPGWEHAQVVV